MNWKQKKIGPFQITLWSNEGFGFGFVLYAWHVANLWYKLRNLTTRDDSVFRRDFVNASIHFFTWRVHILWAGSGTMGPMG